MLVLSLEVAELKMVLCDILNGLQSWSFVCVKLWIHSHDVSMYDILMIIIMLQVSDLPEILLLERGDFRNVFEVTNESHHHLILCIKCCCIHELLNYRFVQLPWKKARKQADHLNMISKQMYVLNYR